ncbi:MAG: glutamine-hydrolyzing carbamoyl-phosphate synthase small subunit [Chitinophagales bacterium]|nr:glutamine-hydrolyzing carbamoyl-phosphate synthase small subunit [Chitinophagales bacterium]
MKIPAVLLLEDGTVYHGYAGGAIGTTTGEICFNTGMTGYQEIFTDPSYFGQILVATHVHIGNYGIRDYNYMEDEIQSSSIKISGLVCKSFNTFYSRQQASKSIEEYFIKENKVAIEGIDTRELVRHIRSRGAMNAIISSETTDVEVLKKKLKDVPSMAGLELSSIVSTKEIYEAGDPSSQIKIAALDLGIKSHILKCMVDRGCYVKIFPAKTSYTEMKAFNANGYFISNGPGDPASMDYAIQTVRQIIDGDQAFFGICLGQQLLGLAAGIPTFKMHHGHRGLNHPVKNIISGRCEITSQNHGFSVDGEAIRNSKDVEITHLNLNDRSIEGLRLKNKRAFSVQYHPESAPGPHDSRYLFDDFIEMIKN